MKPKRKTVLTISLYVIAGVIVYAAGFLRGYDEGLREPPIGRDPNE